MADLEIFRAETRAWLEANCPEEMRKPVRAPGDVNWGGRNVEYSCDEQKLWLERMADKGFVAYELHGNSREYYPLVEKKDYFSKHVAGLIKNHFNDSASQFASFFTREIELSTTELEDLRKIIDEQIEKKSS